MTKVIKTTFKFKRANANEWPIFYVLEDGEPGFEIDTGKLKIGDGTTIWGELNYLNQPAIFNTDQAFQYSDGVLSLVGLNNAFAGQLLSKASNGAITWVTPLEEVSLINSPSFNAWVENKITTLNNRVYKGEAYLVDTSSTPIILYDEHLDPIVANVNDIYSYEDTKYIWNGDNWIELTEINFYASQADLDSAISRIENIENGMILNLANEQDAGLVKSSTDVNKIQVEDDGTMSINYVGVDKLVNNGYTLILDSGQSN